MDKKKNTTPFFILGRERSGTTMLRVNLNNHSNIYIPPESPFIMHLYNKYHHSNNIDPALFIKDLKKEPFLFAWNINYDDTKKQLESVAPTDFPTFCYYILLAKSENNNILAGDKNPTNSLFGLTLKNIYPDAKFIWIIRDYRAQVNSMLKVNFEKKIVSSLAARWVSFNKEIEKLKHKYPNDVLLVKYEDLVTSPEEHYKKICSFLGVEYEQNVLNTQANKKEFYNKHHKSLNQKINTSHIDEWKQQLTPRQIKICECVAGKYGEKFEYKRTTRKNRFLFFSVLFGVFYGACYKYFVKMMYVLPLSIKVFINEKIIYKNSTFWKEIKEHYSP